MALSRRGSRTNVSPEKYDMWAGLAAARCGFVVPSMPESLDAEERMWVFLFQAEDGIRDADVTGVQTCALPIWPRTSALQNWTIFPDGFLFVVPRGARSRGARRDSRQGQERRGRCDAGSGRGIRVLSPPWPHGVAPTLRRHGRWRRARHGPWARAGSAASCANRAPATH